MTGSRESLRPSSAPIGFSSNKEKRATLVPGNFPDDVVDKFAKASREPEVEMKKFAERKFEETRHQFNFSNWEIPKKIAPQNSFWRHLYRIPKVRLLIPDTIIFGEDSDSLQEGVWIFTNKAGYLEKREAFSDSKIISSFRAGCDPDIPVAVVKKHDYSEKGNAIQLLFAQDLDDFFLRRDSGSKMVFQQFIRPRGRRAYTIRSVWSSHAVHFAWMLSSKVDFGSRPNEPPEARFCTNSGDRITSSFMKQQGAACADYYKITDGLVRYLHEMMHPRVRFSGFVVDYVKAQDDRIYMLQVKAFQIVHVPHSVRPKTPQIEPANPNDPPVKREKKRKRSNAVMKSRVCRSCLCAYSPEMLTNQMTLKMICDTQALLRRQGKELSWFGRPEFRIGLGEEQGFSSHDLGRPKASSRSGGATFSVLHEFLPVCRKCYLLYKYQLKLAKVVDQFALLVGYQPHPILRSLSHTSSMHPGLDSSETSSVATSMTGGAGLFHSDASHNDEHPTGPLRFGTLGPDGTPLLTGQREKTPCALDAAGGELEGFDSTSKASNANERTRALPEAVFSYRIVIYFHEIYDFPSYLGPPGKDLYIEYSIMDYTTRVQFSTPGQDPVFDGLPLSPKPSASSATAQSSVTPPVRVRKLTTQAFFADEKGLKAYLQVFARIRLRLMAGTSIISESYLPLSSLDTQLQVLDKLEMRPVFVLGERKACFLKVDAGIVRGKRMRTRGCGLSLLPHYGVFLPARNSEYICAEPLPPKWLHRLPRLSKLPVRGTNPLGSLRSATSLQAASAVSENTSPTCLDASDTERGWTKDLEGERGMNSGAASPVNSSSARTSTSRPRSRPASAPVRRNDIDALDKPKRSRRKSPKGKRSVSPGGANGKTTAVMEEQTLREKSAEFWKELENVVNARTDKKQPRDLEPCPTGDGGPARSARMNRPRPLSAMSAANRKKHLQREREKSEARRAMDEDAINVIRKKFDAARIAATYWQHVRTDWRRAAVEYSKGLGTDKAKELHIQEDGKMRKRIPDVACRNESFRNKSHSRYMDVYRPSSAEPHLDAPDYPIDASLVRAHSEMPSQGQHGAHNFTDAHPDVVGAGTKISKSQCSRSKKKRGHKKRRHHDHSHGYHDGEHPHNHHHHHSHKHHHHHHHHHRHHLEHPIPQNLASFEYAQDATHHHHHHHKQRPHHPDSYYFHSNHPPTLPVDTSTAEEMPRLSAARHSIPSAAVAVDEDARGAERRRPLLHPPSQRPYVWFIKIRILIDDVFPALGDRWILEFGVLGRKFQTSWGSDTWIQSPSFVGGRLVLLEEKLYFRCPEIVLEEWLRRHYSIRLELLHALRHPAEGIASNGYSSQDGSPVEPCSSTENAASLLSPGAGVRADPIGRADLPVWDMWVEGHMTEQIQFAPHKWTKSSKKEAEDLMMTLPGLYLSMSLGKVVPRTQSPPHGSSNPHSHPRPQPAGNALPHTPGGTALDLWAVLPRGFRVCDVIGESIEVLAKDVGPRSHKRQAQQAPSGLKVEDEGRADSAWMDPSTSIVTPDLSASTLDDESKNDRSSTGDLSYDQSQAKSLHNTSAPGDSLGSAENSSEVVGPSPLNSSCDIPREITSKAPNETGTSTIDGSRRTNPSGVEHSVESISNQGVPDVIAEEGSRTPPQLSGNEIALKGPSTENLDSRLREARPADSKTKDSGSALSLVSGMSRVTPQASETGLLAFEIPSEESMGTGVVDAAILQKVITGEADRIPSMNASVTER